MEVSKENELEYHLEGPVMMSTQTSLVLRRILQQSSGTLPRTESTSDRQATETKFVKLVRSEGSSLRRAGPAGVTKAGKLGLGGWDRFGDEREPARAPASAAELPW